MAAKKTIAGKGKASPRTEKSAQSSGNLSGNTVLRRPLKIPKKRGAKPGTMPSNMDALRKYQFKKGQSGNPGGKLKTKPIYNAMLDVLRANPEFLGTLVEQAFVNSLHDGRFFKEVRDMLDGKPPQSITGADGGALQVEVTDVRKKLLGDDV